MSTLWLISDRETYVIEDLPWNIIQFCWYWAWCNDLTSNMVCQRHAEMTDEIIGGDTEEKKWDAKLRVSSISQLKHKWYNGILYFDHCEKIKGTSTEPCGTSVVWAQARRVRLPDLVVIQIMPISAHLENKSMWLTVLQTPAELLQNWARILSSGNSKKKVMQHKEGWRKKVMQHNRKFTDK